MGKNTSEDRPSLTESGRIIAFSDAVFAIIITLLVIEIHRPDAPPGGLGAALLEAWPSYAAFALAFVYVGVIWLNHHGLFRHVGYVDLKLNWINLGILGTSALIPFPTGVLAAAFESGDLADQRSAVVLYAIVAGLMSAAWLPIFPYLERHRERLASVTTEGFFGRQRSRPIIGIVAYGAAALLSWFIAPTFGIAIFVLMVAYHAWTSEGVTSRVSS